VEHKQVQLHPVDTEGAPPHPRRAFEEALRIYQDVAFAALYLLASVVASLRSAHSGCLHRLAVDDAGTGLRISAEADPEALADGRVELLPGAV
jgi:hypothetical protein